MTPATSDRRQHLLLFMGSVVDPWMFSTIPSLAALASRHGWKMEFYLTPAGKSKHFGGGVARDRAAFGTSFVGGEHWLHLDGLLRRYRVSALAVETSSATAYLELCGVKVTLCENALATYVAAFDLVPPPIGGHTVILDGSAQGKYQINTAAFCYPFVLAYEPVAFDIGDSKAVPDFCDEYKLTRPLLVGVDDARVTPEVEDCEQIWPSARNETHAAYTVQISNRFRKWGKGFLIGDELIMMSSIARAAEMSLLPVYGRPQVDAINSLPTISTATAALAWGRQFDDRDFGALSKRNIPIQLIDPGPPFHSNSTGISDPPPHTNALSLNMGGVDAEQLREWEAADAILVSPVFWSGMLREQEAVHAIAELAELTDLKAGIALSTVGAAGNIHPLKVLTGSLGSDAGALEPLVGSLGRGIGFECEFDYRSLAHDIGCARADLSNLLATEVVGWWPLLDGQLIRKRRRIKLREGKLVLPRDYAGRSDEDLRTAKGMGGSRFDRLFLQSRPFEWHRSVPPADGLVQAVQSAGFKYMLSKSTVERAGEDDRVTVVPSTGPWRGWSPFRTLEDRGDVKRAESHLRRHNAPGVIVFTIDSPLWLMAGEQWRFGSQMWELAEYVTSGGDSGRLVNVTPQVAAEYHRFLKRSPRAVR